MNEIGSCLFLPYRKDGLIRLSHFMLRIQSSAEKHVSYINGYVRKKGGCIMHPKCFLIYGDGLPDLREGHVGVDVLKPGFVAALHVCELGKEQLLLCIG